MATSAAAGHDHRTAQAKASRKTTRKAGAARATPRSSQATGTAVEHGVRVHTAHPRLSVPYLTRDDLSTNLRRAGSALSAHPRGRRLAFYGGLGVLAAAGAVDWPVAVAIGAATAVARGGSRTAAE